MISPTTGTSKLAVRVSRHAIEQFTLRSGSGQPPAKIERKLVRMYQGAREMRKRDCTLSLLNNGCKDARYFYCKTWVLVVVDQTIATCFQPKMREFETF